MSNAIKNGRPIVAFVENAPLNRGFSTFELPTALSSPGAVMNGYPMRAFTGDTLAFSSQSATEFRELEHHLAASATQQSGRPVSVADLRAKVDVIGGYHAVQKTMFGLPLSEFSQLNLDGMAAASKAWSAAHAAEAQVALESAKASEMRPPVMEQHLTTGPPSVEGGGLTRGRVPAAPGVTTAGSSGPELAIKGLGLVGAAAVVHDATTTVSHAVDLQHQGNITGSQSAIVHFTGRTVGMLAGAEIVGAAATLAGAELGLGALPLGAAGAIVGAIGGDKLADAVDQQRIHTQQDAAGNTWTYADQQGWTRMERTLDTDAMRLNDGFPVYRQHTIPADPALTDRLNYQASNTSVELQLARPFTPADPYTQPAGPGDTHSDFGATPWQRDAQTHAWTRQVTEQVIERHAAQQRIETASPTRAAQLDQAAQHTIADNLAQSSQRIAQHYQAAYQQYGWSKHGPIPQHVSHALETSEYALQASDGHTYTRSADGSWTTPGTVWGTNTAEGNVRDELNATQLANSHANAAAASGETAAAPHAPAAGLSRTMTSPGVGEHARAQAAMHGGDAPAQRQAAKILSDQQRAEPLTTDPTPGRGQPSPTTPHMASHRDSPNGNGSPARGHESPSPADAARHAADAQAQTQATRAAEAHVQQHLASHASQVRTAEQVREAVGSVRHDAAPQRGADTHRAFDRQRYLEVGNIPVPASFDQPETLSPRSLTPVLRETHPDPAHEQTLLRDVSMINKRTEQELGKRPAWQETPSLSRHHAQARVVPDHTMERTTPVESMRHDHPAMRPMEPPKEQPAVAPAMPAPVAPQQSAPSHHGSPAMDASVPTQASSARTAEPVTRTEPLHHSTEPLHPVGEDDTYARPTPPMPSTHAPAIPVQRSMESTAEVDRDGRLLDPRHAAHPDHAMHDTIRDQLVTLHDEAGLPLSREQLDRLTASVLIEAKRSGLTDVTHLEFGENPETGKIVPTIHVLQAFRGDLDDPRTGWGAVDAQQAVNIPVEQSHQQLQTVNQQLEHQQQQNQQLRLQEQQQQGMGLTITR
ncbi:XVIPCD domain-containing protein [Dyella subtropica]|uniref:XVIPCD domain-containing protein n=1 Tax=Dyella subtropica TaxID=2992127 RepID=UPI0022520AED|nr:XVIPCD domain-containing protein [Dyella subtropica]